MAFVVVGAAVLVVAIVVVAMGRKKGARTADEFGEAADEMRYMKPTPIADIVDIVDQMDAASPGYRHYAEVNGISGTDQPIVGPYSQKPVAYYEVKCFQVVRTPGGTEETLLAHEKSLDPFFITDGSCDTKLYVDMVSFGSSALLINSCNRMEGPNSEFARTAMGLASSSTQPFAVNMVHDAPAPARPGFGTAPGTEKGPHGTSVAARVGAAVALGACDVLDSLLGVLDPGKMSSRRWGSSEALSPSYGMASAGAAPGGPLDGGRPGTRAFAAPGPNGFDNPFGGPFGGPAGGPFGGPFGGPAGHRPPPGGMGGRAGGAEDLGSMIGGMVMGGMLASLLSQSNEADNINPDTFMGYRIVENIIPVEAPVYSIGEAYRSGGRHFIGKAQGQNAEASYVSPRPEEEVIAAMATRRGASKNAKGTGTAVGAALAAVGAIVLAFGVLTMVMGPA